MIPLRSALILSLGLFVLILNGYFMIPFLIFGALLFFISVFGNYFLVFFLGHSDQNSTQPIILAIFVITPVLGIIIYAILTIVRSI